jgi:hypothetical protein
MPRSPRPRTFLASGFLLLAVSVCAQFAAAQATAPCPGNPDPRRVDATQFGERIPSIAVLTLQRMAPA